MSAMRAASARSPVGPRAVVFDVDGTLADTERHGHRVAFNRAFEELGLPDRWDEGRYGALLRVPGGEARLRYYFTEHAGQPEEEAWRLAARVHRAKTRIFREIASAGAIPPRPGVVRFLDDLAREGMALGVATTGSREWVIPLLASVLRGARARFDAVVTGDDVGVLKPDPEAFTLAACRLGLDPNDVVAIEDSRNGVRSATAAGMRCVAVVSDYNEPAELREADLVLDGYGEPGAPARVLFNPRAVSTAGMLDARTVRVLHARVPSRAAGRTTSAR